LDNFIFFFKNLSDIKINSNSAYKNKVNRVF
jgi:hypothetical protein